MVCEKCGHAWAQHGGTGCAGDESGTGDFCWCDEPVPTGCYGNVHVLVGMKAGCGCGEVVKRR